MHRAAAALRAYDESEEGELASDDEETKQTGLTSVKSTVSPRKPPRPDAQDSSAAPPPSARPVISRERDAPPTTRLVDVRAQTQQSSRYASLILPPHTP